MRAGDDDASARCSRKSAPSAAGKLICGMPRSRTAVASRFTRRMTLPMMTRSGLRRVEVLRASTGVTPGSPTPASMSLMGG